MNELIEITDSDNVIGGNPIVTGLVAGLVLATYSYMLNHWDEFKQGVKEGYNLI